MNPGSNRGETQVLIVGGGIAGLETVLALHELTDGAARMTVVAPDPEFTYRPLLVREPFGPEPAGRISLEPALAELGVQFRLAALGAIDPVAHTARLDDGSEIGYEYAVICAGARLRPAFPNVRSLWTAAVPDRIDELLEGLEDGPRRVSFIVPPGVSWALPLYEVALMTSRLLRERGDDDVEIQIVTPEAAPLIIFGPAASDEVAGLLSARGVAVSTETWVAAGEDGELGCTGGHADLAGIVIALPRMHGFGIAGLPADPDGFVPIDRHARVEGVEDTYAAGDGANFPVKQGGIGTQQADAAAEHIASRLGCGVEPQPFKPVLRGKLLTGGEPLHMRAEIGGGGGEGTVSADYLWWPPHKVSGRRLAPWLAHETSHVDPEPPTRPVEVEVALPVEWHGQPMMLNPEVPLGVD